MTIEETDLEIRKSMCELVYYTVKDCFHFFTELSDDKKEIILTVLLFNFEKKIYFKMDEIYKQKNSTKGFIGYIKQRIFEELNIPKPEVKNKNEPI